MSLPTSSDIQLGLTDSHNERIPLHSSSIRLFDIARIINDSTYITAKMKNVDRRNIGANILLISHLTGVPFNDILEKTNLTTVEVKRVMKLRSLPEALIASFSKALNVSQDFILDYKRRPYH